MFKVDIKDTISTVDFEHVADWENGGETLSISLKLKLKQNYSKTLLLEFIFSKPRQKKNGQGTLQGFHACGSYMYESTFPKNREKKIPIFCIFLRICVLLLHSEPRSEKIAPLLSCPRICPDF